MLADKLYLNDFWDIGKALVMQHAVNIVPAF